MTTPTRCFCGRDWPCDHDKDIDPPTLTPESEALLRTFQTLEADGFQTDWRPEQLAMLRKALGWVEQAARAAERAQYEEALERLWAAADTYRRAVGDANQFLNEDLPSSKALVFALGNASKYRPSAGSEPT